MRHHNIISTCTTSALQSFLTSAFCFYDAETPYPDNMELVFIYSVFIKGDHTYFDIESCGGVNGTELYPDVKYMTVSEFLDTLL